MSNPEGDVDSSQSTVDSSHVSGKRGLDSPARETFWALVPRRDLVRAAALLLLLLLVIALRVRAVPLARSLRHMLYPAETAPRVHMGPVRSESGRP